MSDTDISISRRRFCGGACQVATGVTLATLFTSCSGGSSSSSPTSPSSPATLLGVANGQFAGNSVSVTVAGTALSAVGGAVLVQSVAGVFLLSRTSDAAFTAIEGVCTHEGCTITGSDGADYVCPCHGSRYNHNGQVVNGPAVSSLRKYATTFSAGVVTIAL
jgi:cytochrome b6-f complex iron-sulfur subunit